MYINKVVFIESEYVEDLRRTYPHLIQYTDYGTTELFSNFISDAKRQWEDYKETFDLPETLTYEEFKEYVADCIGLDVYEALENNEIDFCLIV